MADSFWHDLIREVEDFRRNTRELRVCTPVTANEIRACLSSTFPFDRGMPLDTATREISQLLRQWSVHVTHPRYFGLFNPSVREAAIVGDLLAALYNPQQGAWSHNPAMNEMERHVLRAFTKALGLPEEETIANFTSGGAEANLSAVCTALAHHFPQASEDGLASLPKHPCIYVTEETHHSLVKIARMVGLGTKSIRAVPTTDLLQMDCEELVHAIRRDRDAGWMPFLVIGTAGTTSAGVVDPLAEIARIARQENLWFHADGAWGAAAVLSPRLRPILSGIEQADSVTWDAHKWLSVPMGAGMFFCRHANAVRKAFAVTTSYMPPQSGPDTDDSYTVTTQWSRRAIGLKVFFALAELGLDGYANLIDHQTQMGEVLRHLLENAGWSIVNDTPLPVVCFTHDDIVSNRCTTAGILKTIYEHGKVWISDVVIGNQPKVLRACITSYLTNEKDLQVLIEELEHARNSLL